MTVNVILLVVLACGVGYLMASRDNAEKNIKEKLAQFDESQEEALTSFSSQIENMNEICEGACHDLGIEKAKREKMETELEDLQTTVQMMKGHK